MDKKTIIIVILTVLVIVEANIIVWVRQPRYHVRTAGNSIFIVDVKEQKTWQIDKQEKILKSFSLP